MKQIRFSEIKEELKDILKNKNMTFDKVFKEITYNKFFFNNSHAIAYLKTQDLFKNWVREGSDCIFIDGNEAYIEEVDGNYFYTSVSEEYQAMVKMNFLQVAEIVTGLDSFELIDFILGEFSISTRELDFIEKQRDKLEKNIEFVRKNQPISELIEDSLVFLNQYAFEKSSVGYFQKADGRQYYYISAKHFGEGIGKGRNLANRILIYLFWIGLIKKEPAVVGKNKHRSTTFSIPSYDEKLLSKAINLNETLTNHDVSVSNLNRKKLNGVDRKKAERIYGKKGKFFKKET